MPNINGFWDDFEIGEPEDLFLPVVMLIIMIFVNSLYPEFAIGFPTEKLSQEGKYVTISVVAPISEEFAFRLLGLGILETIFGIFAVPIQAGIFALMHWQVYGLGLQSAFIGAFVIGTILGWYMYQKRSFYAFLGVIIFHAGFNTWLAFVRHLVIGM